jgi:hypothetical protein
MLMSMQPFIEAIEQIDTAETLGVLIEQCVANDHRFTPEDVAVLWETCWATWDEHDADQRLALGELMATMKASYPTLPGKPSWAVLDDPEAV